PRASEPERPEPTLAETQPIDPAELRREPELPRSFRDHVGVAAESEPANDVTTAFDRAAFESAAPEVDDRSIDEEPEPKRGLFGRYVAPRARRKNRELETPAWARKDAYVPWSE